MSGYFDPYPLRITWPLELFNLEQRKWLLITGEDIRFTSTHVSASYDREDLAQLLEHLRAARGSVRAKLLAAA